MGTDEDLALSVLPDGSVAQLSQAKAKFGVAQDEVHGASQVIQFGLGFLDIITEDDFVRQCDWSFRTRHRHQSAEDILAGVRRGHVVCVQGTEGPLTAFFANVFHYLHTPITLVTLENDETVPPDKLRRMLDEPNLLAWMGWNTGRGHPKLHPMPIGLNKGRHLKAMLAELAAINGTATTSLKPREKWILFNFGLHSSLRAKLWEDAKKWRFADRRQKMNKINALGPTSVLANPGFYDAMRQYPNVVSPAGVGTDCHRTWEALYLGIHPIVVASDISDVYSN